MQPLHHALAHIAAQIEQRPRIGRADQHAHPHHAVDGVGHLQDTDASVPLRIRLQDAIQLGAHAVERHREVHVELSGAHQLRRVARPVLERLAGEVGTRQHESALIPHPDHDIGQGDLFDPAPLVLQDNDVADPDGPRERDLDAGEHRPQRGLRSQAGDDGQHTGGGEQRLADVAERRERHQGRRATQHDDDRNSESAQGGDLGHDLASVPVGVAQPGVPAGGEPGQHLAFHDLDETGHQPGDGCDQRQEQQVVDPSSPAGLGGGGALDRGGRGDDHQRRACRAPGQVGDVM